MHASNQPGLNMTFELTKGYFLRLHVADFVLCLDNQTIGTTRKKTFVPFQFRDELVSCFIDAIVALVSLSVILKV